jgi:hypothetical protein
MPPQEKTGMASSVRPKRRYFIGGGYDRSLWFKQPGTPGRRPLSPSRTPRRIWQADCIVPGRRPANARNVAARPHMTHLAPYRSPARFRSLSLSLCLCLAHSLSLALVATAGSAEDPPIAAAAREAAVGAAAPASNPAPTPAPTPTPRGDYETGLTNILKIASELHIALDPRKQQGVQAIPVYLEQVSTPCITPIEIHDGAEARKTVQISAGFIRLMNSVAHAKALSETDELVKAYAARLASMAGDTALPSVTQGLDPAKAWDFETMNIQASQFNQMAGALVAIDLAHHYLGHYKKYSAQLATTTPGSPAPAINNLVSEKEWREAVLKGAKNALDCGLGVDGLKTLLQCIEAMPSRPEWSAYFVPSKANLPKITKDLQRLENDFFLVEK